MTVHFIGAGPGAPDLITVRGLKLIQSCPVCLYAGSLVPAEVVAEAPEDAEVIDTAPLHLDQIMDKIFDAHDAGLDVARVHSGDPSVYGAIAEQMRRLDIYEIPYDVTPGVPAFAAFVIASTIFWPPARPAPTGGAPPPRGASRQSVGNSPRKGVQD